MAQTPTYTAVLVDHGEHREITARKAADGTIEELVPGSIVGFLDFSINGGEPFRVTMPVERYRQTILPQFQ